MSSAIPAVPTTDITLSDDGLKNLAGWIARYLKIDNDRSLQLFGDGHSVTVGYKLSELLANGDLVKYEPSLIKYKLKDGYKPHPDEFSLEPYEFEMFHCSEEVYLGEYEDDHGIGMYISFYLTFLANNRVEVCAQVFTDDDKRYATHVQTTFLEKYLNTLGLYSFEIDRGYETRMYISWLEADEVIQIIKNGPQIPEIPTDE